MSKEDATWLQEALKAYTFNDTDRLQEICKEINEDKATMKPEYLHELLDELQELVELHPRNNHNLCLSGGMVDILGMILTHPDKSIKRLCCSIFSAATSNNNVVQEFSAKLGALNLTQQCNHEEDLQTKEALFSSLSSFVKSHNF